tara:strand:- start:14939 stop:15826 length:888 start_codon:yes stop_codon:yes gene_type:complete
MPKEKTDIDNIQLDTKFYNHEINSDALNVADLSTSKTLNSILTLQDSEKKMLRDLEDYSKNNKMSNDEVNNSIRKINELTENRLALYDGILQQSLAISDRYGDSYNSAMNQKAIVNIVEAELNNIKKQINAYKSDLTNKFRLIEINDYYDKKYTSQTNILKVICYMCLIIIVILVVNKKEYISELVMQVLIGLVLGIGLIIIILRLWNIFIRDNQKFDEIDWFLKPSAKDDDGDGGDNKADADLNCPVPKLPGEPGSSNPMPEKMPIPAGVTEAFTLMPLQSFKFENTFNHVKLP